MLGFIAHPPFGWTSIYPIQLCPEGLGKANKKGWLTGHFFSIHSSGFWAFIRYWFSGAGFSLLAVTFRGAAFLLAFFHRRFFLFVCSDAFMRWPIYRSVSCMRGASREMLCKLRQVFYPIGRCSFHHSFHRTIIRIC